MTAKEYQKNIRPLIKRKFQEYDVELEWAAFRKLKYQYSPRVDLAIGPFSTTPGQNRINEYNNMVENESIRSFLQLIYNQHIINVEGEYLNEINIPAFDDLILKNQNARCFIALEIENSSSKKHIMGSMVNAASLGRIGIGIAYNESVKRTFLRIMNYLSFLKRVEKNTYDTTNFLIITVEQLKSILDE